MAMFSIRWLLYEKNKLEVIDTKLNAVFVKHLKYEKMSVYNVLKSSGHCTIKLN